MPCCSSESNAVTVGHAWPQFGAVPVPVAVRGAETHRADYCCWFSWFDDASNHFEATVQHSLQVILLITDVFSHTKVHDYYYNIIRFYCETSKERIRKPRFCAKSLTQKWDTLVVREAIYYDVMGSCILPVSTSSPELLDSNYCAGTSARSGTILMVFEKHWGFFFVVVAVIISQSMKKAVVIFQFCPENGRMSSQWLINI